MDPTGIWLGTERDPDWRCEGPSPEAARFHRSLPDYAPTPLVDLPEVAAEFGVGRVLAKDESMRLGLPAFKALGASWAIHRSLRGREDDGPLVIVTATDGNHGRAVARFARRWGHRASIVVPSGVHPAAVRAIRDEGAEVTEVVGPYDDAVAEAARIAADDDRALLVQDTAWEGYEEVPGWIVEGYATLWAEVDEQLGRAPTAVMVPAGVGSLLQSALAHYRSRATPLPASPPVEPGPRVTQEASGEARRRAPGTAVVSVEPTTAACVLASAAAGVPVAVETGITVMAGLNCGTVSTLAWPYISGGLDGAVAVTDEDDAVAARDLAGLGVRAGPCGASGLAGLRALLTGDGADGRRAHLGLDADSTIVLLVTEGADANPALEDRPGLTPPVRA